MFIPPSIYGLANGHQFRNSNSMPSIGIDSAIQEFNAEANQTLYPDSPRDREMPLAVSTTLIEPTPAVLKDEPSRPVLQEETDSAIFSLGGRPKAPISSRMLHKEGSKPTAVTVIEVGAPDPDALKRIWCTYARAAHAFDEKMIAAWHKTLDVVLIFSGIFSAILTPFIVESYKLLDPTQSSLPFFGHNGYKVRVNAMWFGSLVFSLVAALLSIHCKQWLDGYGVDLVFAGAASGCPESLAKACRLRQYRYQGLHIYGIPSIIGTLPVLLYAALVFFAAGLIDFLWHLNEAIAIYISCLCGIVVAAHVGTTLVPCFTTASPFKTPLSNFLGNVSRRIRGGKPLDEKEVEEVLKRKECLDEISYKWLMTHTRSEEVYLEAYNAHKAHLDLKDSKQV